MRTETFPIRKLRLPEGFSLRDVDEDVVELLYYGEVVADFAARGVDPDVIVATAEAYISVSSVQSR